MPDTALVALFTGASTAIAALVGVGSQLLGESRRARHELERVRDARDAERAAEREQRLRRGTDRVRAAVLRLAVTVRVCADIRRDQHARLHERDLIDMLGQARDHYYRANVRIEALRALVGGSAEAVAAIEGLLSAVTEAYEHVRSASSEQADPELVEKRIRSELRRVSEAVLAE
ncbi:hypothetical protein NE236_02635 [Actinoallomurus purpureus]|uniref:hypothetical protein n=1 Tax=Actinoallomurus purpureus TaxID=478114 RepID=UPI00209239D9|nr:hypothetical protein [Actinoallomurus purpureus]MCO6003866.1 hypothetical protein [Actinoallomurus purpureus]